MITIENPNIRYHRGRCQPQRRRSGYVYIVVIMTAIIVSALAMSSVWIARKHALEQTAADEAYELASAADSAIELALARIAADASWRNNHVHNTEYGPFALGDVSLYYRLLDSSNDIANGRLRDVTVIGIAKRGSASCAAEVTATPAGPALTFLNYAASVYGDINMPYRTTWTTTGAVFSMDDITLDYESSISGTAHAKDQIRLNFGSYIRGSSATNQPSISVGNQSLIDRYIAEATTISVSSLPTSSGRRKFTNCLLSPNHNPFGTELNPKGIYVIDLNGANLDISNCRILGTLILRDLGDDCRIWTNVLAQPAVTNYPSLYIDGDMEFESRWGNFKESDIGVNLNPTGAPYQGQTNSTQADIYPARIEGICYCRGETEFNYNAQVDVQGVFYTITLLTSQTQTSLRVTYDSDIAANPPPGFRQDTIMQPVQGTYRRIATP
jgi:hypothetical protein